ncbi:MAG: DUF3303 family protein [Phycisphaerales bacterium]|nr:DUF3303 family protein [Planctomycetota bacterium]
MLFMIIEQFKAGKAEAVGERFKTRGRLMPSGVVYHASWLDPETGKCFQVMEAGSRGLIDEWIANWSDLVDFEVTPVVTSKEYWEGKDREKSVRSGS